jgi:UDP-N-acetylmuramate dehydrogenase
VSGKTGKVPAAVHGTGPAAALDAAANSPAGAPAPDWAKAAAEITRDLGIRPRRNEPMAGHTTMRVGGPADLLAVARDVPALVAFARFARANGLSLLLLGRGSDVVVADAGIRGLVVLSRCEGWRIHGDRLIAEAGLPLARAATVAGRAGLSGLEFGLAIPGTVGGAVWANAGAHGADVACVLESVTILRADGTEATEPTASLSLAYRDSRFKNEAGEGSAAPAVAPRAAQATSQQAAQATTGTAAAAPASAPGTAGDIVLTATFRLAAADPVSIRTRLDEIRRWRQEHQPLTQPSAGSVFRNPPGDSAGRLIDACGLRGASLGGASISAKHANFIVNMGGATASDVRRLAERARIAVAARFGIELVYEVQFVGDWSTWPGDPEAPDHSRPGAARFE